MKKWPIAETFKSVQGEGLYAGTPMFFIRLAGCNVGKYLRDFNDQVALAGGREDFHLIQSTAHSMCCTVTGEKFVCDTDYHTKELRTAESLIEEAAGLKHVCITGGEPFLHKDLAELVEQLEESFFKVHIETSGTLEIPADGFYECWVTCCPKAGYLEENDHLIDEWKLLWSPGCDLTEWLKKLEDKLVYIQPVNYVNHVDNVVLDQVLDFVIAHPFTRLSPQLHKFLGVR